MTDITLGQAQAVAEAARRKGEEIGATMNIAVVDAGANQMFFAGMDNAWLGSVGIALKKARTARLFDMPTGTTDELFQQGASSFNIEHSNGGLIGFPGGLSLYDRSGAVIGAIGVSGSTVEEDPTVADAVAAII